MNKATQNSINLLLISISIHAVLFFIIFFTLTILEREQQKSGMRTKIVLQQYVSGPLDLKNDKKSIETQPKKRKVIYLAKKKKSITVEEKKKITKSKKHTKQSEARNPIVEPSSVVTVPPITVPQNSEIIYPNNSIKSSYGPKFFDLSKEEQEYIITNWELTNNINSGVSGRIARKHDLTKVNPGDSNTIQFYLHPDGKITDITFLNKRDGSEFDEIIKQTIMHSHMYYNFPKTKTLMQIYISVDQQENKD